jgi:hypothetical protein
MQQHQSHHESLNLLPVLFFGTDPEGPPFEFFLPTLPFFVEVCEYTKDDCMGFLFGRKIFVGTSLLMALLSANVHAAGVDSTRFIHLFGVSGGMHKPGGDR